MREVTIHCDSCGKVNVPFMIEVKKLIKILLIKGEDRVTVKVAKGDYCKPCLLKGIFNGDVNNNN